MKDKKHEKAAMSPEMAADIAESAEPAPEQLPPEEVAELLAALTQCRQELAESQNAYLRAHADFDNFRKRLRTERDQEFARGSERVLADLLPIVDDFERALASVNEKSTVESLTQGVGLIYRQFVTLLERYAVVAMEVEGKPFDPHFHDAVVQLPTPEVPEHTIVGVMQKGYLKNGDVFRPAKVAVSGAVEQRSSEQCAVSSEQ